MKRIGVERLSRFIKFGTGAVIGAAAIAVFCRGYISLKNSSSSDIVTSTLTVSTVSTASSASSFSKSTQQPSSSEPQTELININTATSEELQTLSGIGEVKAAAIIAYREEHGAFSDISEIMNVSGIGEKTFENIRDRITTGGYRPPSSATSQSAAAKPSEPPEAAIININTATSEELQTLPGIGEVKAAAIIAYREEHGAFSDISEIINVSGIGEKTFENIRGRITV